MRWYAPDRRPDHLVQSQRRALRGLRRPLGERCRERLPGPLAGILAGLAAARHDWLLVLPCDAPLIDQALLQALRETAEGNPATPVMVKQDEQWQPMFCLLPVSALGRLQEEWQKVNAALCAPCCAWVRAPAAAPLDDPRLANLNTPSCCHKPQRVELEPQDSVRPTVLTSKSRSYP